MADTIYLYDTPEAHENLLPLSYTRPIADFRVGITTIKEKWDSFLAAECRFLPVDYLIGRFGLFENEIDETVLFVAGGLLPDEKICQAIEGLEEGEELVKDGERLALRGTITDFQKESCLRKEYGGEVRRIRYVYDLFLENHEQIRRDFRRLTKGRKSQPLPDCTRMIGEPFDADGNPALFIEEGAEIECVTVNIKRGPVYIGKNTVIMEGGCIRGPLAVCDNTKIRMGAKIYGGTTFGPYCKIGGEVDNSVIFGYTNKAHDGYLGNAVIGEWCNIGAGVNASNLKNDYSKIRVWNYREKTFKRTDLQFCGLIMGDHSKIGVNCMLNTATVIGVGVNLHGTGFPRVFLPGFREGSPAAGFTQVTMKKFKDIAGRAMQRRNMEMSPEEESMYDYIYSMEWPEA